MLDLFEIISSNFSEKIAKTVVLIGMNDLFVEMKSKEVRTARKSFKQDIMKSEYLGDIFAFWEDPQISMIKKECEGNLISKIFDYGRLIKCIDFVKLPKFNQWIENNKSKLNQLVEHGTGATRWGSDIPADFIAIVAAGFLSKESDPYKIFEDRFSKKEYVNSLDESIILWIGYQEPKVLSDACESKDFHKRFGYKQRSLIYKSVCAYGEVSQIVANRIRTDPSGEAALEAMSVLLRNLKRIKEPKRVVQEIIQCSQITVLSEIANNIDVQYLPFLIGVNQNSIRSIVGRRISDS